jgi:3-oxoacyl-[acyl-carrier protein] reductase
MDLQHQTALVTGANRGIGKAIAENLAAAGVTVLAGVRQAGTAPAGCQEIILDVADEASVQQAFSKIDTLDILINNAGIGRYGDLADFSSADFDAVLQTNLRGVFLCSRAAMQLMRPQNSGYIICIGSVVSVKGYPQQAAYTASKHGVLGLCKSLAVEAQAANIRVSAVLPGGVDTDMVAQARPDLDRSGLIQAADIAHTVRFLLTLPSSCAIDQIALRRPGASPF